MSFFSPRQQAASRLHRDGPTGGAAYCDVHMSFGELSTSQDDRTFNVEYVLDASRAFSIAGWCARLETSCALFICYAACRNGSWRPLASFAELVRLSRISFADEMWLEHTRRQPGG
jgi:hypothetical protein